MSQEDNDLPVVTVYVISLEEERASPAVRQLFLQIRPGSALVAVPASLGNVGEEEEGWRIWARDVGHTEESKLLSAFYRASDYVQGQATMATFSGCWFLPRVDCAGLVATHVMRSKGDPLVAPVVEKLEGALDLADTTAYHPTDDQ